MAMSLRVDSSNLPPRVDAKESVADARAASMRGQAQARGRFASG
jgi:hypothetical protein